MLIGRSKKAWLFLAVQDISKFNHVSPWPSNDKALLRGYHHGEATNRCVYWTLWTLTLLPLMLLKGYQDKRLLGRGFSRARTLVINSLIQRCGRAPAKCPNIVCWYRNKTTIFVFLYWNMLKPCIAQDTAFSVRRTRIHWWAEEALLGWWSSLTKMLWKGLVSNHLKSYIYIYINIYIYKCYHI